MSEKFPKAPTPENRKDPLGPLLGELNEIAPETAEKPPHWLKKFMTDIAAEILDQKDFESRELYEKAGIRTIKKYLPLSGDLMTRLVWKKIGAIETFKGDRDSMDQFINDTKFLEIAHEVGFAITALLTGALIAEDVIDGAAVLTAVNVLVNVLPVMIQRYNRIRVSEYKRKIQDRGAKEEAPDRQDNSSGQ